MRPFGKAVAGNVLRIIHVKTSIGLLARFSVTHYLVCMLVFFLKLGLATGFGFLILALL
jgi:hypothetical protein